MIVEANLTCTKLLGYDRNHLINRRFSQFVDMQSRDRWHQFLKFAIQKQLKQECELPLRRADGSVVEILLSSLLINVVGSTTMLNIALADISERKQSEQNEQKLNRQIKQCADRLNLLSRHHVAAQEEIRHRLSSELHSRTSSNLAAINNNLDIISTNIVRGESIELLNYLDDIRALLTDTTISIREISADLQPPALSYAGLVAAVESYRQLFEKRTGITVLLNFDNQDARFPRQLENLLFRIVQEALTNCAKHAQATQVKITLKNASFPLLLTIADNGIGFDLEALGKEVIAGLGLLNMREMVEIAGGTLNIISTANQGTRICVEILNGGE
jgi:PAS domain S-box-containing protein